MWIAFDSDSTPVHTQLYFWGSGGGRPKCQDTYLLFSYTFKKVEGVGLSAGILTYYFPQKVGLHKRRFQAREGNN